ncbi:MAG: MFS transporter, partial [Stellaceae bacterium]
LAIDFALYTRVLGWSPEMLGVVIGAGLVLNAIVTVVIGPLSDHFGRRGFILGYEGMSILTGVLALFTAGPWALAVLAALAGWGRGANGAPALFGAVEQAWLSRTIERRDLSRVFSYMTAAGFFGTAIGMALGGLPALLAPFLPSALAYRPLFGLAALGDVICLIVLAHTPDPPALAETEEETRLPPAPEAQVRRQEYGLLARLAGLNALNGVGIGLVGPLLSWWFAERYGVGPAAIGPALSVALLLCGFASLAAAVVVNRLGTIRLIVGMRALGLVMLVLLPFAPSYPLAMLAYGLRLILNRGTAGPRQALAVGLVRPDRRGLAASVNSFSIQLTRSVGPALAGLMFGADLLMAPFLLGALCQGIYLALYARVFRAHDPVRRS